VSHPMRCRLGVSGRETACPIWNGGFVLQYRVVCRRPPACPAGTAAAGSLFGTSGVCGRGGTAAWERLHLGREVCLAFLGFPAGSAGRRQWDERGTFPNTTVRGERRGSGVARVARGRGQKRCGPPRGGRVPAWDQSWLRSSSRSRSSTPRGSRKANARERTPGLGRPGHGDCTLIPPLTTCERPLRNASDALLRDHSRLEWPNAAATPPWTHFGPERVPAVIQRPSLHRQRATAAGLRHPVDGAPPRAARTPPPATRVWCDGLLDAAPPTENVLEHTLLSVRRHLLPHGRRPMDAADCAVDLAEERLRLLARRRLSR
jgi:hypothetical protein